MRRYRIVLKQYQGPFSHFNGKQVYVAAGDCNHYIFIDGNLHRLNDTTPERVDYFTDILFQKAICFHSKNSRTLTDCPIR